MKSEDKKDLRASPQESEYTPSKPGVEAAAPLDAQDAELVRQFRLKTQTHTMTIGHGQDEMEIASVDLDLARSALLSRLSSLRESVASLTADRNEALIALGKAAFEIKELEGDRDALRKALEAVAAWHVSTPIALPVDVALLVSAALSPTSPQEAQ